MADDPGYSLVPVDYQPEFDHSLVPVDYDPFADESPVQMAQAQPGQVQSQASPAQPLVQSPQGNPTQLAPIGQPNARQPNNGDGVSNGNSSDSISRSVPIDQTSGETNPTTPSLLPGYSNPNLMQSHHGDLDRGNPSNSTYFPGFADPKPMGYDSLISNGMDKEPSEVHQKIVDLANAQIGSDAWSFKNRKGNFGEDTDKCNLFVHDILADAGADPGLPEGHWWWKRYPPTAEDWTNRSIAIPGWRLLGLDDVPRPGDVAGQRIQWSNGATGHVMIVGPDGDLIGVGKSENIERVGPKNLGEGRPSGLLVYRRYAP